MGNWRKQTQLSKVEIMKPEELKLILKEGEGLTVEFRGHEKITLQYQVELSQESGSILEVFKAGDALTATRVEVF